LCSHLCLRRGPVSNSFHSPSSRLRLPLIRGSCQPQWLYTMCQHLLRTTSTVGLKSPNLNPSQNLSLPPRSSSSHLVINGTEQFDRSRGLLCFKCRTYDHVAKNCILRPLSYWEQSYLKQLLFGGAAKSYYANISRSMASTLTTPTEQVMSFEDYMGATKANILSIWTLWREHQNRCIKSDT